MDITFTVIAWSEMVMVANEACQSLEKKISPFFQSDDFGAGVKDFIVVAVAVSEDDSTNSRFYDAHTRSGYIKDPLTGAKSRSISVGVPLPLVESAVPNEAEIARNIVSSLKARLKEMKFPSKFDKERFSSKLVDLCDKALLT